MCQPKECVSIDLNNFKSVNLSQFKINWVDLRFGNLLLKSYILYVNDIHEI